MEDARLRHEADFFTARHGRGELLHCPRLAGRTSSLPAPCGAGVLSTLRASVPALRTSARPADVFTARRGGHLLPPCGRLSSTLLNLMYRTPLSKYLDFAATLLLGVEVYSTSKLYLILIIDFLHGFFSSYSR